MYRFSLVLDRVRGKEDLYKPSTFQQFMILFFDWITCNYFLIQTIASINNPTWKNYDTIKKFTSIYIFNMTQYSCLNSCVENRNTFLDSAVDETGRIHWLGPAKLDYVRWTSLKCVHACLVGSESMFNFITLCSREVDVVS